VLCHGLEGAALSLGRGQRKEVRRWREGGRERRALVSHQSVCSHVAHPPGYPLFTLLARLAMFLLPSLSPAHSVNLMCSLLEAAACGALCITVCR
uniref:Uncharacterized protein n=1 Tax=Scophthalmus maximus TaxID=52904 RepID=A0A8D3CR94_SCOMX